MTDDASSLPHLHPDDRQWLLSGVLAGISGELRALMEATAKGPAQPPPGRPPADFDGFDARQFDHLKKDILRDVGDELRKATADFLPEDDIQDRLAKIDKSVGERLDVFRASIVEEIRRVVAEENAKLRSELFDIFDDLGMSLEKGDKRKATRERLSGLFAMHDSSKQFWSDLWKQARGALIGWIVAGAGAVGAYFWSRGGSSH